MLFTGKVTYADGIPAQGVRVSVFDKDAPGKRDDDLTVAEGTSSADGTFKVKYDSTGFRDYVTINRMVPRNPPWDWTLVPSRRIQPDVTDAYLPYLRFSYQYDGQKRSLTAPLQPFVTEFQLPEAFPGPLDFSPSGHGFHFVNNFPGYPLPVAVPGLPSLPMVPSNYGLCGGMSAAAADFFIMHRSIPNAAAAPPQGSLLHTYLYQRQISTFGGQGETVTKMAAWMALTDLGVTGTQRRTYDEFELIRAKLDDNIPVVLGLVYVSGAQTLEIWENHQVLAYGYSEPSATSIHIKIYDPNYPDNDNVRIEAERVIVGKEWVPGIPPRVQSVWGLVSKNSENGKTVRGFFGTPYTPIFPPAQL
jgi:hypothetical protein